MDALLEKVKANLILDHTADDDLLKGYITAAVSYAESYQHIPEGYYPESSHYSHHVQELALEEIGRWMEAYRFTHPNVAAITVRVLFERRAEG